MCVCLCVCHTYVRIHTKNLAAEVIEPASIVKFWEDGCLWGGIIIKAASFRRAIMPRRIKWHIDEWETLRKFMQASSLDPLPLHKDNSRKNHLPQLDGKAKWNVGTAYWVEFLFLTLMSVSSEARLLVRAQTAHMTPLQPTCPNFCLYKTCILRSRAPKCLPHVTREIWRKNQQLRDRALPGMNAVGSEPYPGTTNLTF